MAVALGQFLWTELGLKLRVIGPGMNPSGTTFELAQPFARIGRFSKSDVRLDSRSVSRWHLFLLRLAGGVYFLDLGSRKGIQRGGVAVAHGWANAYQPLVVGPYSVFIDDGSPAPSGDPLERIPPGHDDLAQVQLTFRDQRGLVGTYQLGRALTILGRSAPSNLRVADMSVGKAHAALYRTAAGVWLINLIGIGVEVGGRSVVAERLDDGSKFHVGELEMQVALQPPRPLAPVRHAAPVADDAGSDEALLLDDRPQVAPPNAWEDEKLDLEQEIERLRADAQAMEQLLTELDADKDETIRELRAAQERERTALREEVGSVRRENEALLQRLSQATRELVAAREEANARMDELSIKLADLVSQRAEDCRTSQQERSGLERALDESRRERDHLREELATAREESSRLDAALRDADSSARTAQAELAQVQEKLERVPQANEPTPDAYRGWETQLADADRAREELVRQLGESRREGEEWRAKYEQRTASVDDQSQALAAAVETQDRLRREVERLVRECEQLTAKLTEQQTAHLAELQSQSAQVERLRQEWGSLRQELTEQREAAVAEARTLLLADGEKSAELLRRERQLQSSAQDLCAAQLRIEELTAEGASLSSRLAELEAERASRANRQTASDENLALAHRRFEEAQTKIGELTAQLQQAIDARERSNRLATAAEEQRTAEQARSDEAAAKCTALEIRLRDAEAQCQRQTQQATALGEQLHELRRTQSEWQQHSEESQHRLAAELDEMKRRRGMLETELARRDREQEEMRRQSEADKAEIARKSDELADLTRQLAARTAELTRTRDEFEKFAREREAALARRTQEAAELKRRCEFEAESNRLERLRHQRELAFLQQKLREMAQAQPMAAPAAENSPDSTVLQGPQSGPELTTEWTEVAAPEPLGRRPGTIFDNDNTVAEPGLRGEVPTDQFEDLSVLPPLQSQSHLDVAERLIDRFSDIDRKRQLLIRLGWSAVGLVAVVVLVLLAWWYFPAMLKALL